MSIEPQVAQNVQRADDAHQGAVFIDDESALDGLPEAQRTAAAASAEAKGRPGAWAIANERGAVWAFLTHATRRELREQVWRMWTDRGDHAGAHDNKPLIAEMLDDGDVDVRDAVARELIELGPAARPAILGLLRSDRSTLRIRAVRILRAWGLSWRKDTLAEVSPAVRAGARVQGLQRTSRSLAPEATPANRSDPPHPPTISWGCAQPGASSAVRASFPTA